MSPTLQMFFRIIPLAVVFRRKLKRFKPLPEVQLEIDNLLDLTTHLSESNLVTVRYELSFSTFPPTGLRLI